MAERATEPPNDSPDPVYRCPHCHETIEWVEVHTIVPVTDLAPRGAAGRGSYKITDDYLTRVMAIWSEGGIHAVMSSEGAGERTARRWLALARSRGLANGN